MTEPLVDDVDRTIIDLLRADGRLAMVDLARQANISRTNAFSRVRRLRESGVIRGFTARVDPEALGLGVSALITVKADQNAWRGLRAELADLPGVVYLALTSGEYDFVLHVRVADVHALRDVVLERLHDVAGVSSTSTIFILDEDDRRW